MVNQMSESALSGDVRASDVRASFVPHELDEQPPAPAMRDTQILRVPVGTNLADVERWMIFATLQKCSGNKTRAAALLGVSLKTLYNRLNAYRAQGVAMDDGLTIDRLTTERDVEINALHGELTEVPV